MLIIKLPYTEVKFYPELESQAGLSSLLMKGDKNCQWLSQTFWFQKSSYASEVFDI